MRFLRKIFRLFLIGCWFPVLAVPALPGLFRGRAGIRTNARITRLWAAGIARILGLRITVDGDPEAFAGGLIVSNHTGYVDILAEAAIFPIRFAPKVEIRSWPLLGWYVALSRPIWIDRRSRARSAAVARELEQTLRDKISTLVYPEGTSTDGEHGLLPFKSTPFEAACRVGEPILPVLIQYQRPADGYPIAWYGDMTMPPHVWHLLGQPEIRATLKILPQVVPAPGEDRKALAERVHALMDAEYRRMT